MSQISQNLARILSQLHPNTNLVAVTKTKPIEDLQEAYQSGFKRFGENKVQEMTSKYEILPKDIEWHMIGHLQSNKVKYIAPYVSLIHGVDSIKLLKEINKEAAKNNRIINCLLQIHIAREETKFGLSEDEAKALLLSEETKSMAHIHIKGLMGMASNTEDEQTIENEFAGLKSTFDSFKSLETPNITMQELSMGMSGDYILAMRHGSTLVRIGSAIFGGR